MERAASVLRPSGRLALIVPISFQFSADYNNARAVMTDLLPTRWCSTYSRNPSALFTAGLGVRSTILIGHRTTTTALATTSLRRWYEEARPYLFDTARYAPIIPATRTSPWQRTGDPDIALLYSSLTSLGGTLADATQRRSDIKLGFKKTALYYISIFIDDPPAWLPNGRRTPQTKIGYLSFPNEELRDIAFCLLSGRLATWWWGATGDDFDVTAGLLGSFPIAPAKVEKAWPTLLKLAKQLRQAQPLNPIVTRYNGKEMGNYDMLRCRPITDQADRLVLETLVS